MEANKTILQMKYARIVSIFAEQLRREVVQVIVL